MTIVEYRELLRAVLALLLFRCSVCRNLAYPQKILREQLLFLHGAPNFPDYFVMAPLPLP